MFVQIIITITQFIFIPYQHFNKLKNMKDTMASIGVINNNFYEFYHKTRILYCYNSDGELHDQFELLFPNDYKLDTFICYAYFQNKFILFSNPETKFICF